MPANNRLIYYFAPKYALKLHKFGGIMGSLNVSLEGYSGRVVEFMLRAGFAKTKAEALRLALFEFDQRHRVVPDEEQAYEIAAAKILGESDSWKARVKKFRFSELD